MGQREVVGITLDRERVLLYRTRDVVDLERDLGMGFVEALTKAGVRALVAFLHRGLQHQDEKLTPETVQRWVDLALNRSSTFAELWNRVTEALVASGWLRRPDLASEPDPTGAAPSHGT